MKRTRARCWAGAAVLFACAAGAAGRAPGADSIGIVSASKAPGNISGPADAQNVLARMRAALGGEARLGAVRTLLITGANYSQNNMAGARNSERRFTRRMMLPDAFQERLEDLSVTFTVVGDRFWRRPLLPVAGTDAGAHREKLQLFTELCLVMLVRSPTQVAMSASMDKAAAPGTAKLLFTGDVARTLELDAQWRPHVLEHPVDVYSPAATVPFRTTRRLTIEEWNQAGGIWFPATMSIAILPRSPSTRVTFRSVRVNEGVSRSDFLPPMSSRD